MKKHEVNLRPIWRLAALAQFVLFAVAQSIYGFNTETDSKTVTSDGSHADTAAALAFVIKKNEDDWTVTVGKPGESYTWPTTVNVSTSHRLTIRGASATARPTIKISATSGFGFILGCTEGKTITVKDLHFDGWQTSNALFLISGGGDDCFRLSNLEFTNGHNFAAWVSSPGATDTKPGPYGLFDHCTFPNGGGLVFVRDNPAAVPDSWHRPMSWGTKHAVYIEDCTFSAPEPKPGVWGVGDGDTGGRLVVRHCILTNMPLAVHGADSQPLMNGENPNKSMLQVEFMHNTVTVTGGLAWMFFLRGGSATVFDNTIKAEKGGYLNSVLFTEYYRSLEGNGVCPVDRFYPKDYLGTQQPGYGVIDLATYDGPKDPKKPPGAPWGSVPIYYWGNRVTAPVNFSQVASSGPQFCFEERDYFAGKARPGYNELTYPHPLQSVPSSANGHTLPEGRQNGKSAASAGPLSSRDNSP